LYEKEKSLRKKIALNTLEKKEEKLSKKRGAIPNTSFQEGRKKKIKAFL